RGRISTWPDVDSFNGLSCIGPLARTVDDAALLLDVLTGNHPTDRDRPPAPQGSFLECARRVPQRLRVGLAMRPPFVTVRTRLDPSIRAATERIAGCLTELGHEVTEVQLPYSELRYALLGAGIIPRGTAGVGEWLARHPDPTLLDPRTREWGRFGRVVGRRLVPLARRLERPYQRLMGRTFERVDVVLTPTTASPALPVGALDGLSAWETDSRSAAACPYAWPWNVLGWPGVNVPCGLTGEGLPIGAQLLGRANAEPVLLALARQLEGVEHWAERVAPHGAAA
ncbi:MAG: amidase family protein, partial [Solirubrobacteraceae bacterium]